MTDLLQDILDALDDTAPLMVEFEAICDTGGRFSGTESEKQAVRHLKQRIETLFGRPPDVISTAYDGWSRQSHALTRLTPSPLELECLSLVWSPSTPPGGLEADVVDMGRGELSEFESRAKELAGRIPLVRHEYMFTENTLHRSYKYAAARAAGAVAFLIANHLHGKGLLSGSSGRNQPEDIPAFAITAEGAAQLAPTSGRYPRVCLESASESPGGVAENLVLEIPGEIDEWIVLSAHIDGHPLGESAMDNATGLATVLHVAHTLASRRDRFRRGLRIMLFNVEEWGLWGSAKYVESLSPAERDKIALNINLDSVAGNLHLTAITSGYPKIGTFLSPIAEAAAVPLATHDALMRNSDHYNFAAGGIPAFRLVSGFDLPDSHLRYVLMREDTRDKVAESEMRQAARLTGAILVEALTAETLDLRV